MKQEYPKWLYHKSEAAKIVASKDEHESQGSGWEEAPFATDQEQDAKIEESKADQIEAGKESAKHVEQKKSEIKEEKKTKLKSKK